MKVLANPTLVAANGETASFLAGGEYPIPVVQGTATESITIEYREYGVRLTFRPIVLGDGAIRLYVAPEVSELTDVGGVTISGFSVPALLSRKFETTLELNSGQTFIMAGLIKQNIEALKAQIPGFGDLPILGPLFSSIRYTKNDTELAVFVTASLVEPMSMDRISPLPGFLHVEPNDWEVYLETRIEGKQPATISPADAARLKEMGLDNLVGPGAWDSSSASAL
jgi:pilus assembly protein CpaC